MVGTLLRGVLSPSPTCMWTRPNCASRAWGARVVEPPEKDDQLVGLLPVPKPKLLTAEKSPGQGRCPVLPGGHQATAAKPARGVGLDRPRVSGEKLRLSLHLLVPRPRGLGGD